MLLPAMTLFDDPTRTFRKLFFRRMNVHAMANFSNLAEVLFAGRSRVPAAAFIYRVRDPKDAEVSADQQITVYSPLVANQEPTPRLTGGRETKFGTSSSMPPRFRDSGDGGVRRETVCPGNLRHGAPIWIGGCWVSWDDGFRRLVTSRTEAFWRRPRDCNYGRKLTVQKRSSLLKRS